MTQSEGGLCIVVPAFNEAEIVCDVVTRLRVLHPFVVVVDDGSSDGTGGAALRAGAIVLRHPINLGQGAAIQTGIEFALRQGAAMVCTFDADGQHDVADIGRMVEALGVAGAEVALGSRFLGSAPGMPWHRRVLLRLAIWYTRLTTRLPITDAHNGLRLLTAFAASKIRITQNRMAHASEILDCVARSRLTLVEVPVTITYSAYSMRKGQKSADALNVLADLIIGKFRN